MQKSDFTSNYTGLFGRGNYLHRELLALVEHAEMHPATAEQLETQFELDSAQVLAALAAAKARTRASGPNAEPYIPATGIAVSPTTVSLVVGGTRQLTATPTPADATGPTTSSSSNPAVATVSAPGLVTAVSAGTATINASRAGASAGCVVTVTAA